MEEILTKMTTSISEFRSDMPGTLRRANGEPFAVLSNNKPAFYVVSPELFDHLTELAWEAEITPLLKKRLASAESNFISVDINEL